VGAVFVDAGLPHPSMSWLDAAPPGLRAAMLRLAAGGRLPPWDAWFPPGTLDGLLPEPALRARFVAELPRLPLGYFAEAAPPEAAVSGPSGYLQLSAACQEAADEAARRGWPTLRAAADHLAPLTRPAWVVDRLARLVRRLGPGERR
jgi:hypothetical protein